MKKEPLKPSESLSKAAALLDRGFTRNALINIDDEGREKYCMLGAIAKANWEQVADEDDYEEIMKLPGAAELCRHLREVQNLELPENLEDLQYDTETIPEFNDRAKNSKQEILSHMCQVVKKLRAEGR